MALTALRAMVRKDLQLFFSDRKAVIMSFAAPILIASFFGSIFGSAGSSDAARIPIMVADQDNGVISQSIVTAIKADKTLGVTLTTPDSARESVRTGKVSVGVIIPAGFGDAAGLAFFNGQNKPELNLVYDPSRTAELGMVRGMLMGHVVEAIIKAARPDAPPMTAPFTVKEQPGMTNPNAGYNAYAHSFAGMGIQFLLFAAIDLGIGILLERQRGLWKRLRSAPLSKGALLGGKALSGMLITLLTLLVSFTFAIVVFKVRIAGSVPGFLMVAVATALMASNFGLLIAALGRTPGATRGVSILATLMMVMLGGAWIPTFFFPAWLQKATVVVPTRWAIDGIDAMTWRGVGLSGAVLPTAVLLGFAALFGGIAVWQFRWEES